MSAESYCNRASGWLLIALMIALLLGACTRAPDTDPGAGPTPTGNDAPVEEVVVESIEVLTLESFPVQIHAVARGRLPDACAFIEDVVQRREGNTFHATFQVARRPDARCAPAPTPFEHTVPLDVAGREAGSYTVEIHGATATFELAGDNVPGNSDQPAETPAAGAIGGRVWHDLCAIGGGEGGEPATPSEGCVPGSQGGYAANGILEEGETGIEGIEVLLGTGSCPSTGLTTATTDASGTYRVDGLAAGDYCVSIAATQEPNAATLLPGGWTFPAVEQASTTVTLQPGEVADDINFGWDYQFAPEAAGVPGSTPCTDRASFLADVTIPDGTAVEPGAEFVKAWRIRNEGDCTWGSGYRLEFVGGDALGVASPILFQSLTPPGATTEISLAMTAPETAGTYRSEWKIRSTDGIFGVGPTGEAPLYAEIVVGDTAVSHSGGATIRGWVWRDECRIAEAIRWEQQGGSGPNPGGCITDQQGNYRANGITDNGEKGIGGVTVRLSPGACPGSEVIRSATTTADRGRYAFTGLSAGTYCISIDASAESNAPILLPGDWTYPEDGDADVTVTVAQGEIKGGIDFGWEYPVQ